MDWLLCFLSSFFLNILYELHEKQNNVSRFARTIPGITLTLLKWPRCIQAFKIKQEPGIKIRNNARFGTTNKNRVSDLIAGLISGTKQTNSLYHSVTLNFSMVCISPYSSSSEFDSILGVAMKQNNSFEFFFK